MNSMRLYSAGIEFCAILVFFAGGGWFLDQQLEILDGFPLFLLSGMVLGLGLGIYRLQLTQSKPRKPADPASGQDSKASETPPEDPPSSS
ncbi:MAG: hypothetical protein DWQ01_07980 [Planctomycetota bacterium]|nr:MAG: hypothetical protein DWQ01_07980 [Planctomycetota bacterium]